MVVNIKIKVKTEITVVTIPIFLDLVQPTKEIIESKDIIPNRRVAAPSVLWYVNSLLSIFSGYPGVVIIMTAVHANMEIRNKPAANVEVNRIYFISFVLTSATKRFAITKIEKPPKSETIKTVWLESLFQYSKLISLIIFFYVFVNSKLSFPYNKNKNTAQKNRAFTINLLFQDLLA